ncbi:MAG: GatB/YqeY domain-containing protein, partial [Tistlia sp.]
MLRQQLNDALKEAMRARDQRALATIRLILAALKDRDIQARTEGRGDGVEEQEILEMLQKMVRQRRDAIELYAKGQRQDLVEREEQEIAVIERFLPKPLDEAESDQAVSDAIVELEDGSIKDIGRVMSLLKDRYPGRLD